MLLVHTKLHELIPKTFTGRKKNAYASMSHALQEFIILHVHAPTRTNAFTQIFTNDQKYLLVATYDFHNTCYEQSYYYYCVIFENQVD